MSVGECGATGRPFIPGRKFCSWMLGAVGERVETGRLVIRLPRGGDVVMEGSAPGPYATLILEDWRVLRRVFAAGALGFAQGYIAGEWSSPDLPKLIEFMARNPRVAESATGALPARVLTRLIHAFNANTRRGSRRNISYHYDLGNAFYERWLDRGMQYSSALYSNGDTLETAQARKLDRITAMLALDGGERVLEIGCGWGAVAEQLARDHDCHVTGLTLSQEQLAYARARLGGAGLGDRAAFRLQDYRDCEERFDRIVSIEMIEAVGERYWPHYFDVLRQRLEEGGSAVLQAITIAPDRFGAYRRRPDFIQRYIFPGGMLPTLPVLRGQAEAAGLRIEEELSFGDSYARTLAEWRRRFHHAWPEIEALGFDDNFQRMWDYYLAYCEAGFRAGTIDVSLIRLVR